MIADYIELIYKYIYQPEYYKKQITNQKIDNRFEKLNQISKLTTKK